MNRIKKKGIQHSSNLFKNVLKELKIPYAIVAPYFKDFFKEKLERKQSVEVVKRNKSVSFTASFSGNSVEEVADEFGAFVEERVKSMVLPGGSITKISVETGEYCCLELSVHYDDIASKQEISACEQESKAINLLLDNKEQIIKLSLEKLLEVDTTKQHNQEINRKIDELKTQLL